MSAQNPGLGEGPDIFIGTPHARFAVFPDALPYDIETAAPQPGLLEHWIESTLRVVSILRVMLHSRFGLLEDRTGIWVEFSSQFKLTIYCSVL